LNQAVEDALVENYQYLTPTLDLPDPGDRHVLAAAIVGHADAIVTFNLKDFPEARVSQHLIEVLHPDDFLVAQYDLDQIRMLRVIKACRTKLRNPRNQLKSILRRLSSKVFHRLVEFCATLSI
jgi:hypothetical protein